MVTKKEATILRRVKKVTKQALKKQTQDGLAKVFTELSCKGVAREIKAGRKVTGNAAFGIRVCVHGKLGPTINVKTGKFSKMTKRAKQIEKDFIKLTNKMLVNGGFKRMPSTLLSGMRKKDRAFERRMKKEYG